MKTKNLFKKIDNLEYTTTLNGSYFNGGLILLDKGEEPWVIDDSGNMKKQKTYELIVDYKIVGDISFDIEDKYYRMIMEKMRYLTNMNEIII